MHLDSRLGSAPALGLRAGRDGFVTAAQTAPSTGDPNMRFLSWIRHAHAWLGRELAAYNERDD
jgi:hypothetical protein